MYHTKVIEEIPNNKTRKLVIFSLIISVLLVFVAPVLYNSIVNTVALASPTECPPGQEGNCFLVKHRQTGNTICLPKQAVLDQDGEPKKNSPWEIIGECPVIPTATATKVVEILPTRTLSPSPTATIGEVQPTHAPTPTINCTATIDPGDPGDPGSKQEKTHGNQTVVIATPCNECANQATVAAALSTLAANDTIRLQTQVASGSTK